MPTICLRNTADVPPSVTCIVYDGRYFDGDAVCVYGPEPVVAIVPSIASNSSASPFVHNSSCVSPDTRVRP